MRQHQIVCLLTRSVNLISSFTAPPYDMNRCRSLHHSNLYCNLGCRYLLSYVFFSKMHLATRAAVMRCILVGLTILMDPPDVAILISGTLQAPRVYTTELHVACLRPNFGTEISRSARLSLCNIHTSTICTRHKQPGS